MSKIIIVMTLLFITGCSELITSMSNRSFVEEMDRKTDGIWVPGNDFPVVSGDKGKRFRDWDDIYQRTPATYKSKQERMQEEVL